MTARSTFRLVPIAAACLLAAASLSAQAQVVVNTGPGSDSTGGWTLDSEQSLAGFITLDSQITIGTVSGWMNVYNDQGPVVFAIYSDVSGLPGTALYSKTVTFTPTSAPEWKSATGLNWTFAPGNYWVVFDGSQTSASMPEDVTSPLAGYAGYHPSTGWYNAGPLNFGVQVAAVPEPQTYAMLLAGLGLMGTIARRKKSAA